MSGTFPSSPAPNDVLYRSITPTRISTSHSMKQQRSSVGAQRWSFDLSWQNVTKVLFAPIFAFAVAQRGQFGTFQISLGNFVAALGSWAGAPVVNGANQSGRSVALSGFTAGATGKSGDFFKFSGHSKVYMLTADFTANGAGQATLSFEPALMATPANGEAVSAGNVPFTCAFTEDVAETGVMPGGFYSFTAKLIEVF